MKKVIIAGVILASFLILTTPCISALNVTNVKEKVNNVIEQNNMLSTNKDGLGCIACTLLRITRMFYFLMTAFTGILTIAIPDGFAYFGNLFAASLTFLILNTAFINDQCKTPTIINIPNFLQNIDTCGLCYIN